MRLDRLRLVGFKSFADNAELAIEPGLTGIVGPNGCGKSNLAEALRWGMGENSARRLRGGDMDDVIFAGAAGRPARNLAEVVLNLDNTDHDAPVACNETDEIAVVRRIERGGASIYRINGREVRARDVQVLFADATSGGHSAAMIGQGQVAALIAAKPAERRALLEEAAGTAGLQLRRREAESRLEAAEANLGRLDDVIATLATQMEGLQRQARRARRYRRLNEEIRRGEARLFAARWRVAAAEAERVGSELAAAECDLGESADRAQRCRDAHQSAEAALPALRRADSEAAGDLRQLTGARAELEQEMVRLVRARGEADRRRADLAADLDRAEAALADAQSAIARLAQQCEETDGDAAARAAAMSAAATRAEQAIARLAEAEEILQRATEARAAGTARRREAERRRGELGERRRRVETRCAEVERQRSALAAQIVPRAAREAAAAQCAEAERQLASCGAVAEAAERAVAATQERESSALAALRPLESRLARVEAEAEALRELLGPSTGGEAPVAALVEVSVGFEDALAAAFGDELAAPIGIEGDGEAPLFWRDLSAIEDPVALPAGACQLAGFVVAPPALRRRLRQAGWVETREEGRRLQPLLTPGQQLVDRDGNLWRWDGLVRSGGAPSAASRQLRQRRRLEALAEEMAGAEAETRAASGALEAAIAARAAAGEADRLAGSRRRAADAACAAARAAETELGRRAGVIEGRLAAVADAADKLAADLAEIEAQTAEIERDLATLPEAGPADAAFAAALAEAGEARREEARTRSAAEKAAGELRDREMHRRAMANERGSWDDRSARAAAQASALAARQIALDREIAALVARPATIAAASEALAARLTEAAERARRADAALALGEARLKDAAEAARAADEALAERREQRARLETQHDGARGALSGLVREIGERLGAEPAELVELAGGSDETGGETDAAGIAARLDRLVRERDAIGPVNLLAESESAETGARIDGLARERTDLGEAIARLRRGIAALDEEARRRLAQTFARVDEHFSALFARLFGGGEAHLKLTADGDPFAAGLDIVASPAGKRLQSLPLLSGGEQALTALALIFAVFLTRATPVCVLDEVDAPLDDPNVERLCSLVGDIAQTTGTRFLAITHHRITMARADRLYGVTMAEPGVSQLVSVDLARSARLRQSA